MTSRPLRLILVAAISLGTLLSPCAAATARPSGCAMPDCEEQGLRSGSCCCASSPASPQDAGGKTTTPLAKIQVVFPGSEGAAPIADLSPAGGTGAFLQPDDVPLYLLHATLLI